MKILFILEHYYPNIGGVEILFKNLAENLAKDGHEVSVLTHRASKKLAKKEFINNITVIRIPIPNRYLFTFLGFPWILYYGKKYDFFHTTSYNAALPSYFAAKFLKKKCFITFHEIWDKLWFHLPYLNFITRRLFYSYEKFILKLKFSKFIAVSNYTRVSLIKQGKQPESVKLIYNGINYSVNENSQHTPPREFTFTYFGRLGVSKGINILLEGSKKFLHKNKDAKLKLIISKNPRLFLKRVTKFIKKNGLSENVRIFHHLPELDLKKELINSSCIVIPSYSEGFCFAAVETIAMGVPIISSDQGALKEVVSGKYIKMETLDAHSLFNALEKAKKNEWTITPVKYFRLNECVENYKKLYIE